MSSLSGDISGHVIYFCFISICFSQISSQQDKCDHAFASLKLILKQNHHTPRSDHVHKTLSLKNLLSSRSYLCSTAVQY